MTQNNIVDWTELLLKCMAQPNPMFSILERLNKENRRKTSVIGIFPNQNYYIQLITICFKLYMRRTSQFPEHI
ncbi:MAG: hypothetical protein ACFWTN_11950 [Clostridium sp.]